jgi:glycerophosphoryl diester phosphodiesterase
VSLDLRRGDRGRPLVIGHRGAKAVAPENTLASLRAAVEAGVDLVEFDVAPGLRLAHDPASVALDALSLDEALAFVRAAGVGAHLDLKVPGYEAEAVAAVRRHALDQRALVSTAFAVSARRLGRLAPELPVAIGYPRDRFRISRLAWPGALTTAGATALRQAMPVRVPVLLRASRARVLALHHTLCSQAAVAVAHRSGAAVLAWTVNDARSVGRLLGARVDGLVTDDPEVVTQALATLTAA